MKYPLLLALVLFWCAPAQAQVTESTVERIMDRRTMPYEEIEYNAMILLPRLYAEQRTDTFNAVLAYWQKHCPVNVPLFTVTVLNAIRNNSFNEHLQWDEFIHYKTSSFSDDTSVYKKHILWYLKGYQKQHSGELTKGLAEPWADREYTIYKDYKRYYDFLQAMAASMVNKPGLSPAERFLVKFYANPDSTQLSGIEDSALRNTILQENYVAAKRFDKEVSGVSLGVNGGLWTGTNDLAILGPQQFWGVHIGGRGQHMLYDLRFDYRFGRAKHDITVVKHDTAYRSDYFNGLYIGLELGPQLVKTKHSELDLLAGVGYDFISTLHKTFEDASGNSYRDALSSISETANLNIGLSYKFYVRNVYRDGKRRFSYFALQPSYNFVQYRNEGGTSLTGNTLVVRLIYGSYAHPYTAFPYMD